MLGDIAVAWGTVAREAEAEGRRVEDHVAHLVVHGTLHLLGEDHEAEAEAEAMEALETRAMARLGLPDPYAGSIPSAVRPRGGRAVNDRAREAARRAKAAAAGRACSTGCAPPSGSARRRSATTSRTRWRTRAPIRCSPRRSAP